MKKVSTIGFTQTTAEGFFERLLSAGTKTIIDVRLNNTSQLAGFAKAKDLEYLLKMIQLCIEQEAITKLTRLNQSSPYRMLGINGG